jgi:uncharacterized protein YciI
MFKSCIVVLALSVTPVVYSSPLGSATLPMPTEWQTLYAAFLTPLEGGPALNAEALKLLDMLHIQYQLRLQADGRAVVAGGFGDGESPIGMTLLCADSLADAKALAEADPAVQFGQRTVVVREWTVPASRIACATGTQ